VALSSDKCTQPAGVRTRSQHKSTKQDDLIELMRGESPGENVTFDSIVCTTSPPSPLVSRTHIEDAMGSVLEHEACSGVDNGTHSNVSKLLCDDDSECNSDVPASSDVCSDDRDFVNMSDIVNASCNSSSLLHSGNTVATDNHDSETSVITVDQCRTGRRMDRLDRILGLVQNVVHALHIPDEPDDT
jgi:hypothetical protein